MVKGVRGYETEQKEMVCGSYLYYYCFGIGERWQLTIRKSRNSKRSFRQRSMSKLEKRTLDEEIQQLCDWKADWKDRSSEGLGLTTQITLGDVWKALLRKSGLQKVTVQSDIQMDKDTVTGQGTVLLNDQKAVHFNAFHDGTQKRFVGESGGVSCLQIPELKEDYLMLETELTEALFVPMGTEVTFKSEMQKWLGMFWQKGQTVTKSREDVKPKGITDACTEYDIVYHTGEFNDQQVQHGMEENEIICG